MKRLPFVLVFATYVGFLVHGMLLRDQHWRKLVIHRIVGGRTQSWYRCVRAHSTGFGLNYDVHNGNNTCTQRKKVVILARTNISYAAWLAQDDTRPSGKLPKTVMINISTLGRMPTPSGASIESYRRNTPKATIITILIAPTPLRRGETVRKSVAGGAKCFSYVLVWYTVFLRGTSQSTSCSYFCFIFFHPYLLSSPSSVIAPPPS